MISRAKWMAGRYGLMVHYLPPALEGPDGERETDIDKIVDRFDLDRFFADFEASGADWLIFTLGQNTGMYNSPNPIMDRYAGTGHCARRDLPFELAAELHNRGKRFIAYLPAEVSWNATVQKGFGWRNHPDRAIQRIFRQELFQRRWLELIGCWADRFGALLDGWFYDGCACLNLTEEDLDRWYATSRRSNPDAVVAFNNAGYDMEVEAAIRSRDDYFAGEATLLKEGLPLLGWREPENAYPSGQWSRGGETFAVGEGFCPHSRFVPGSERMLWHVLTPIDAFWYHGGNVDWLQNQPYSRYLNPATLPPGEMEPPLYSDRELRTLLDGFRSAGAAVTLNVAIRMNGSFGERTVEQLQRLRRTDPIPSSIATPEKENKEKCQ